MEVQPTKKFEFMVQSMGLTSESAIKLFMRQVEVTGELPFKPKMDRQFVERKFVEARDQERGRILKSFMKNSKVQDLSKKFRATGTKPVRCYFAFSHQEVIVSSWHDVLIETLNQLVSVNSEMFNRLVKTDEFEKQFTSSHRKSEQLKNGVFIETNKSAQDIVRDLNMALAYFDLLHSVAVWIR